MDNHIIQISKSRLNTYLKQCYKGDVNRIAEAIALYTALQHRQAIFFSLLQELEVSVRNAMSEELKKNVPNEDLLAFFHSLINNPQSKLSNEGRDQLKKCISKLRKNGKSNYTADDIIANVTFGFWVFLVNPKDPNHVSYWSKIFSNLFDKRYGKFTTMFFNLKQILSFRNDLYHQDIVWNKRKAYKPEHILADLHTTYQTFENNLQLIAPERVKLRQLATYLSVQHKHNFDPVLFQRELQDLTTYLKSSLSNGNI